jgi:hypothetical protein
VIRQIVNPALKLLSDEFVRLYSPIGRESIRPERLIRTLLPQAFYSILFEAAAGQANRVRLVVSLVCRAGHRGRGVDATTFTKNCDRCCPWRWLATAVLSKAKVKRLLSSEHFSVDGSLLEPGT